MCCCRRRKGRRCRSLHAKASYRARSQSPRRLFRPRRYAPGQGARCRTTSSSMMSVLCQPWPGRGVPPLHPTCSSQCAARRSCSQVSLLCPAYILRYIRHKVNTSLCNTQDIYRTLQGKSKSRSHYNVKHARRRTSVLSGISGLQQLQIGTSPICFSQTRAHAGWEPSTPAEVAAIELIKCTLLVAERSGQPAGQPGQNGGQPGQPIGLASGHPGQALLGRLSPEQLAQSYAYLCTREQVYPGGISKAYALSGAFKESLQVGLCFLHSRAYLKNNDRSTPAVSARHMRLAVPRRRACRWACTS